MQEIDYSAFAEAMAAPDRQPQTTFDALFALALNTVGAKLFTLMSFDFERGVAARFFSNMPDAYPVSGTKPVNTTDWGQKVLHDKQIFVANDIEGIAKVFDDHQLIKSLGCESVINVPVVIGGNVVGTVNVLHEAGHFTPERIAAAETLKLPAAVCFLLNQRNLEQGAE